VSRHRFFTSLAAAAALFLPGLVVIAEPAAANGKVTICHRTHSVTNPYRRITVSVSAVNGSSTNDHTTHLGPVFNTTPNYYSANAKVWGDIIPKVGTRDAYNMANTATLPSPCIAGKTDTLTAQEYFNIELEAGVPRADIIKDLQEQGADGDPSAASLSTLTYTGATTLPVAVADTASVGVGGTVVIPVVSNDTAGTSGKSVSANTSPSAGTVSCPAGGTDCTYTHNGGAATSDAFTYTITDTGGRLSTATVTISIRPAGLDAVPDAATTLVNTPVGVAVLANDGLGTEPTTITAFTAAQNGGTVSCQLTTGGTCTYTPPTGLVGTDTFQYGITDSASVSDTATVTIAIQAAPVAPLAFDDSPPAVNSGQALAVDVTANDTLGTLPTTIISWTDGAHGAVSCTLPTCTYTSDAGYAGPDSFTYTIRDGTGAVSTATVTVTVKKPPTAVNDAASTGYGAAVAVPVLSNDDPGSAPATVTGKTDGTKGTVVCDTTTCTYTPTPGTYGTDSFTYTITSSAGSSTAAVTVTVGAPVFIPPYVPPVTPPPATTPPVVRARRRHRRPPSLPPVVVPEPSVAPPAEVPAPVQGPPAAPPAPPPPAPPAPPAAGARRRNRHRARRGSTATSTRGLATASG
jgi:hypothetical protein